MRNLVNDHDKRLLASGEYRGYKWEVLDNGIGFRCGYVAIPRGHPWFENVDYCTLPISCHGGLTWGNTPYKEAYSYEINGETIQRPAREARSTVDGNDYWVGFDCGHAWDAPDPALYFLSDVDPQIQKSFSIIASHGTIRTSEYVEQECHNIIEQLILARLEVPIDNSTLA